MGWYHEDSNEDSHISRKILKKSQRKINNSSIYHSPENADYLIQTHEVIS